MLNKSILREMMLPAALVLGTGSYLIYHFVPALAPLGPACRQIASHGNTFLIAVMLFLQYIRISPRDLRFKRWHLRALAFQVSVFLVLTAVEILLPQGTWRIIVESALICFICPTASAAGIITDRLGGSLSENMAYVVVIYAITTLLIPAVVPFIHPDADTSFWHRVLGMLGKLFPMLILPGILAWAVRWLFPRLHKAIYSISHWSFYVWGVSLTLAMMLATRAMVQSHPDALLLGGIAASSLLACAVQYAVGNAIGRRSARPDSRPVSAEAVHSASVTAGQALGQKNTGLLIWLGYSFMTPVTSIAGGLYAIFQNLWNSLEIYRKEHHV